MRLLYLDDSGKSHPGHSSKAVAYAGFSVDEADWHAVVRHVTGAKAKYFPRRGKPTDWEIKSSDFLTKNAWNRANNRRFAFEIVDILRRNGCHVYAACYEKAHATKPLTDAWVVPLAFQRLAAKFGAQLVATGTRGVITCDWSTHSLDRHVSDCVQSFVLSRGLSSSIVGGVSYGSSMSLAPIQICDLIAGAFRIYLEGADRLIPLVQELHELRYTRTGTDRLGYPVDSVSQMFRPFTIRPINIVPRRRRESPVTSEENLGSVLAPVRVTAIGQAAMPQGDHLSAGAPSSTVAPENPLPASGAQKLP